MPLVTNTRGIPWDSGHPFRGSLPLAVLAGEGLVPSKVGTQVGMRCTQARSCGVLSCLNRHQCTAASASACPHAPSCTSGQHTFPNHEAFWPAVPPGPSTAVAVSMVAEWVTMYLWRLCILRDLPGPPSALQHPSTKERTAAACCSDAVIDTHDSCLAARLSSSSAETVICRAPRAPCIQAWPNAAPTRHLCSLPAAAPQTSATPSPARRRGSALHA